MSIAPAAPPVVQLRVPTDEDAVAWHRLFDDPEVMRFFGGRSDELSMYEEWTARQRRHDAELGYCLWTVFDADGAVIGFTGAQPWGPTGYGPVGETEIGWRLARSAWGRGYATAAALLTLDRLRAAGVERVVAAVDVLNDRSAAVCRRLGMEPAETFTTPLPGQEVRCFRLEL
ncbi:GNAT family N-acetyltransferase [Streptomyces sp. OfavH-34-F]|uniref:GNAT family N-acetyltransferase n=1 Tax=Streptomyces sp. OfavH-34-F TaxID=2917760 RepID=UPI001EF323E3|nr:GNAT family N-acetyltransferase [Streptomyces sp. OfavH-34-F]MCG7527658.1 GNAT family N-acetyltransferase [Streptomyces sp. OfavH-34-F]